MAASTVSATTYARRALGRMFEDRFALARAIRADTPWQAGEFCEPAPPRILPGPTTRPGRRGLVALARLPRRVGESGEVAFLPEVLDCLFGIPKHPRRRLGDERAGGAAAGPDHVDFLAALEGVVQLALDAAGEGGLARRQLGDQADDHLRLVDHLEVPRVDLTHDVPADLDHVGRLQRHRALGAEGLHGRAA